MDTGWALVLLLLIAVAVAFHIWPRRQTLGVRDSALDEARERMKQERWRWTETGSNQPPP